MKRLAYALLSLGAILVLTGCPAGGDQPATNVPTGQPAEAGADPAAPPPPPPPPPPPSPAPQADGSTPDVGAAGQGKAAEQGKPVDTSSAPSSASTTAQRPAVPPLTPTVPQPARPAARSSIRLSAGVALPQSLPTGTVMSFSVDYEFTQGQPDASIPYAWVIEPAKGEPARIPVRLVNESTLQGFVRKWRPRDGPFQTHIEDAEGNRLSASAELR